MEIADIKHPSKIARKFQGDDFGTVDENKRSICQALKVKISTERRRECRIESQGQIARVRSGDDFVEMARELDDPFTIVYLVWKWVCAIEEMGDAMDMVIKRRTLNERTC
jgi:hypothetical protein